MSITKTIEIEAIAKDAIEKIEALNQKVEGLEDALSKAKKETKKTNKILGGLSSLLKGGLGLGIVIKAFDLLKDTMMSNQKVTDVFATGVETLSIVFNQFVSALVKGTGEANALGTVLTDLLNIGLAPFRLAFEAITIAVKGAELAWLSFTNGSQERMHELRTGIVEAKDSMVELGSGVIESGKSIATNFSAAVDSIKDISVTAAFEQAKTNVELSKSAEVAAVKQQGLIEKYDRQAELQRQIRDDESKSIEERVAANNKLGEILDEQEASMLKQVDVQLQAAQAQYDKNGNQENYIALLEAQNEKEAVQAQIAGFRSEQLTNINSLERERVDLIKEERENDLEYFAEEADRKAKEDEDKKKAHEEELKQKEEIRQATLNNLDTIIASAGQETKIGRALFIAKQAMLVKEQIAKAKATLTEITLKGVAAGVDASAGFMKTASAGFPQNVPLLIAFGAQVAGIFSTIKSASNAAKGAASKMGGSGGGSVSSPSFSSAASIPPAFNVVGASETNQLAQSIGQDEKQPIKAFVVSNDVSDAQSLDRNIIESASIG